MSLPTFTLPFVGTPPYFSGTGTSALVPDVYPVAIDGRPYMIDMKSGRFQRGYEPRVRDSQDISTAPGESAINPGGLWRRGQDSWHLGAGQEYADAASAQDFRFYKSKGINPWEKGHVKLLNTTKLSLSSTNTNLFSCVVQASGGTEYVYVADGSVLKYSSNPFASSPTWTSVTTGSPGTAITGLETNGVNVYIAYTGNDIYVTTPGSSSVSFFYPTGGSGTGKTYNAFGYAKGRGFAAVAEDLYAIGVQSGSHTVFYDNPDTSMRWAGAAPGQNAVYAAAFSGEHSYIYKITLKTDGTLDVPIVSLELPVGEIVSAIHGYLGFILLGTNKGVRFCSTDSNNNLVAGSLIPTTGPVYDFTAEDRFVWFGWTNYDGTSSGLGRLDLSQFTSANTPAYSTDLMYASTEAVRSVSSLQGKRIFCISGVGVVVEDTANLVASGEIESGVYRWGIPDRKFVAKVDARAEPLSGTITAFLQTDTSGYESLDTWGTAGTSEYTYDGSDEKSIEASFKFVLTRGSATSGPIFTRWMARAYAAPFRSQVFVIPVLLHHKMRIREKDHYVNVREELDNLDRLISNPGIVTLQIGETSHTVIVEDLEWTPVDSFGTKYEWDGTATVTMRSVEN
jgi:hypothetical protein